MTSAVLETVVLDAFYGDFQALFGINFSVNEGETVAIVGANGAGKSTLLKSITGLINNTGSSIVFNGKDIGDWSANKIAAQGIALVPEGRQLFQSLSVEENLLLGATVARSGPWNIKSVYDLFPVLKERRKHGATQLSGGQQQMVAIGRALMSNPDVILFDEISLGLAPIIINSIYEKLSEIIDQGTTIVLIEQDISRALEAASRVYCLQEGRVKLEGYASELNRDQITEAYFGVAV